MITPVQIRKRVDELLHDWDQYELSARLQEAISFGIGFRFAENGESTDTYAGGAPSVAPQEWPISGNERLDFIAEISLKDIRPHTDWPECNYESLQFFADRDCRAHRVIPINTRTVAGTVYWTNCPYKAIRPTTPYWTIGFTDRDWTSEERDLQNDLAVIIDQEGEKVVGGHYTWGQCLGIPLEIFDPLPFPLCVDSINAAAEDCWINLLTVESVADMSWGDCGRLSFFIKVGDLRARRFDNTYAMIQSG